MIPPAGRRATSRPTHPPHAVEAHAGSVAGPSPWLQQLGTGTTRAIAAAASGVLLDTAFPSRGWWAMAPLAMAGFFLILRRRRIFTAAVLGWVFGLGFFVPHLAWSGTYVGALPWLALAALEAGFVAAVAALVAATDRRAAGTGATALRLLALAGLWVLQEAARSRVPFGGFPWGRLAFSQSQSPLVTLAALGGAPLVSFAVALAGAVAAEVVGHLVVLARERRWVSLLTTGALAPHRSMIWPVGPEPVADGGADGTSARRRAGPALLAALLITAVLVTITGGAGELLLRPSQRGEVVNVAAVQGNVPRAGLDFNAERRAVLGNHASTTQGLAAEVASGDREQPDLVLWPENASDVDPLRDAEAAATIDAAASAVGVPLLVGAVLQEPADRLTNAGLVWLAGQGAVQRYAKQRPVPFGEYVPYRSFFRRFSEKVDLVRRDFVAGTGTEPLVMGEARIGDLICFEVAFDDLARDSVRSGANLLVVQTNNATFGRSDESVQQLAMSRLRAVEHGRAVAHISTVGVSALILPDGTSVATSALFTQQVLQGDLPLREKQTIATRFGGFIEAGLIVGGVLAAVSGRLAASWRAPLRVLRGVQRRRST